QSGHDHSLYTKESGGSFVALLVCVDDIELTGNDINEINKVKTFLKSKFKIKVLGELKYFLGIEFELISNDKFRSVEHRVVVNEKGPLMRMKERLDQFVDRMNYMINLRRRGDRDGRRGEELEYPFFEGEDSYFDEWGDYGVANDDYKEAPIFDDDQYEDVIEEKEGFVDSYPNFQEDENNVSFSSVMLGVEEESMLVYDTDIEDVIDEEEDNMEDVVVVAIDLFSLKIQTTLEDSFWYSGLCYLVIFTISVRARNINDVYKRIMVRMEERLDQFVDQFVDRMNDIMNPRRREDRNGRRSEDKELENPFLEEEENSVSFLGVVLGVEEESMPVYDTDIKDVIDGEEDNMKDVVVVANDLCSSKIQTTPRMSMVCFFRTFMSKMLYQPIKELVSDDNPPSMGDEHLDTISAMESDEFIKSCVENLVPNPSESEGENGCDMPACFTIFSNILFDADYGFDSNKHHFNAESDLIESLFNHDSSTIPSSSKIDSLLDEFAGELTLLKSIPSGNDKTDCDHENEICLIERLLYDNSSPRPPEEFVSENSNTDIGSFSPSPIPVEDSDSFMEEIDLSFNPDDPMPTGIEEDDDDSERDILIREELLGNYSLSLPENESFYFDIPSLSRPPAKPPDGNTGILNIKMMGDISEQKVPIPKLMITRVSNQEKSPDLLSHRSLENFQLSAKCPMIIHEKNIPILDVPLFHFYPLDQFKYGGN
nr:uncharacterized mitochondrial protein AtMg00810-like [Tanacetum cinerariifolium]GEY06065.1 uncharacterized mitochondrial protein AtMg00810-like [Tanacetum cinerariifolium]GEY21617.1 uncharacterized mitochondrial protein AtMg00810-like [Tanacetum cinerariifolium]